MPSTALRLQGRWEAEFLTSTHLGGSTLQRSTDPETTENKAWRSQANSCIGIPVKTLVCPHHEAWEVQAASGRAGWTHPIPATLGHGAGETPREAGTGASPIRMHLCSWGSPRIQMQKCPAPQPPWEGGRAQPAKGQDAHLLPRSFWGAEGCYLGKAMRTTCHSVSLAPQMYPEGVNKPMPCADER